MLPRISFTVSLALAVTRVAQNADAWPHFEGHVHEGHVHEGSGPPALPWYLHGQPEFGQHHGYGRAARPISHTAHGEGLTRAVTGVAATFTIVLAGVRGYVRGTPGPWNIKPGRFIYVWISNHEQMLAAEVVNNGNGTLTATYSSDYPGDYKVFVEDVNFMDHSRSTNVAHPILGSPFDLTITGPQTIRVNSLPLCGTEPHADPASFSSFWRSGTWISSYIASARHGVGRTGWTFQPKDCVYDTFSHEDFMHVSEHKEPTWLLIVGTSVQRAVFLALVDMILVAGQKDDFTKSSFEKCWGWLDFRVGNLRISYQDVRLWSVDTASLNAIVCHNEKLASHDSAKYLSDAIDVFRRHIFVEGGPWPTALMAPAYLEEEDGARNLSIEVLMDALPPKWDGKLLFVEHMHGLDFFWDLHNPTGEELREIDPASQKTNSHSMSDYLSLLQKYQSRDPARVRFLSTLPMQRAIMFENESQKDGKSLCYGCNTHFHYVSKPMDPKSYHGAKMVHSLMTDMVAYTFMNRRLPQPESVSRAVDMQLTHVKIFVGTVLGPMKRLRRREEAFAGRVGTASYAAKPFEMCTDCPGSLFPFLIKPVPEAVCKNVTALPIDTKEHQAWNEELCPKWCMKTKPVSTTPTGSGPVSVRECKVEPLGS